MDDVQSPSFSGRNRMLINALRSALLLSSFSLSGFVLPESRAAANMLASALSSLSGTDLKKYTISSIVTQTAVEG
jgi:hypothetical protein